MFLKLDPQFVAPFPDTCNSLKMDKNGKHEAPAQRPGKDRDTDLATGPGAEQSSTDHFLPWWDYTL